MNTKFEPYFDKWKWSEGIFEVPESVCANVWKHGKYLGDLRIKFNAMKDNSWR